MTNITAERVRELLHFDPDTGEFRWLVAVNNNRVHAGTVAGHASRAGYCQIRIDGRLYYAHRLAWLWMTGDWPRGQIDHINCNRADNRWCNLRMATKAQNAINAHIRANNTSGFKGVSWHAQCRKWVANINVNGEHHYLGEYDTRERAFIAYMFAAWKYHGAFARIDADYIKAIRKRRALLESRPP